MEKEMTTHSSVLAWRIPGMAEPGGLPSMGSHSRTRLKQLGSRHSWERLKAGGEGDDRGWVGWMASLTRWTWVWVDSGSWWWTGRPGVLRFMGWQRAGQLTNWTDRLKWAYENLSQAKLYIYVFSVKDNECEEFFKYFLTIVTITIPK